MIALDRFGAMVLPVLHRLGVVTRQWDSSLRSDRTCRRMRSGLNRTLFESVGPDSHGRGHRLKYAPLAAQVRQPRRIGDVHVIDTITKPLDEPLDEADGFDGKMTRAGQLAQPGLEALDTPGVNLKPRNRHPSRIDRRPRDGALVQVDPNTEVVIDRTEAVDHDDDLYVRGHSDDCQCVQNSPLRPRRSLQGFTLVEALVVIVIITVLLTLLVPAISTARERARRVVCLSNQRQIALSIFSYANDHRRLAPLLGPHWLLAWSYIPYWWHIDLCYKPLSVYGVNQAVLECPSSTFARGGYVDPPTGTPVLRLGAQLYLPGLPQYGATWYDTDPSAASLKIYKDPSKLLVVDLNHWDLEEGRLASNHAGGNIWNVTMGDIGDGRFIKGANQLYTDGHGVWVTPPKMGKDEGPITADHTESRYSHSTFLVRPYWW